MPCVVPKFALVIVTAVRPFRMSATGSSDIGATDANTVNATPLLATPPTVTVTGPVVAPLGTGGHDTRGAPARRRYASCRNRCHTGALPSSRKFAPAIVTAVPTLRCRRQVVIRRHWSCNTVNATAVAGVPPTVTTMFPVVAVGVPGHNQARVRPRRRCPAHALKVRCCSLVARGRCCGSSPCPPPRSSGAEW